MIGVRIRSRGLMGGAAWLPTDPSGLVMWNEGDLGINTDVDGIYQWDPAGGSGLVTFSEATGAAKPSVAAAAQNGRDGIQFTSDDALVSSATVSLDTFTLFFIFKMTVGGMLYEHSSAASNGVPGGFIYTPSGWHSYQNGAGSGNESGRNFDPNIDLADGTVRLLRKEHGGAHALHKIFINGVETPMTDSVASLTASAAIDKEFNLFSRNEASLFATGTLFAVLGYSPILSAEDAAEAESYLNTGWSVY